MSDNVGFSANQIAVIEWLATSKYDREPSTQVLLAEQLGINDRTITRWKKQPELKEAVTARARELLGDDLPEIYAALRREAIDGSYQHIKLAMEMTGEYTPKQEVDHSGAVASLTMAEWREQQQKNRSQAEETIADFEDKEGASDE